MKVELYIEKEEYDIFYRWINRISLGIYSTAPVRFSHRIEDIGDPLKVSLDSREYTLIKDIQTPQSKTEGFLFNIKIRTGSSEAEQNPVKIEVEIS